MQTALTRIKAISWRHAQPSQLVPVNTLKGPDRGIVVGFTADIDTTEIVAETPDSPHIFQVLVVDTHDPTYTRGLRCACPVAGWVVPVRFNEDPNHPGLIKDATEWTDPNAAGKNMAPGVAFLFKEPGGQLGPATDIRRDIWQARVPFDMWVQLRGDFVLDKNGNAVAVQFLRHELPTSDHREKPFPPSPDPLLLQGGLFVSWFGLKEGVANGAAPIPVTPAGRSRLRLRINVASKADLQTIPEITDQLATQIMAARADQPLRNEDDLRRIGFPDRVINLIRDRISFE